MCGLNVRHMILCLSSAIAPCMHSMPALSMYTAYTMWTCCICIWPATAPSERRYAGQLRLQQVQLLFRLDTHTFCLCRVLSQPPYF